MWPAFADVPWFPAIGDGAANHIGSGCLTPDQFSLMVGTTGAMRAAGPVARQHSAPACGAIVWIRSALLMGGALSNGGDVYAWLKRTLAMPKDVEARLEAAEPGGHGLTVLPFLAGERSPYWRADLRGAITGLSLATEPFDILHARARIGGAALSRNLQRPRPRPLAAPAEVIASGGALLHSPAWTQMMADALGRPVVASTEQEASCRGAALYALERIGAIPNLDALPASTGATFSPRPQFEAGLRSPASRAARAVRETIWKPSHEP